MFPLEITADPETFWKQKQSIPLSLKIVTR